MNTYFIKTYGCQMNVSDSERIASVLESIGFKKTEKQSSADLIVVVACSVRQSAMDRIYGLAQKIKKFKVQTSTPNTPRKVSASWRILRGKQNLKPKIILTGCLLPQDKKKLKDRFDLILDINNLPNWPEKLVQNSHNNSHKFASKFAYLHIQPNYTSKTTAYIPIMNGCNNFCSYCVVPYTRGREYSRPAKEIINEVKNLIKNGYKEIILLGQNVNSYNSRISTNLPQISRIKNKNISGISGKFEQISEINFPQLLKTINNIPGDFWLRFITSHPKDMSDELIETMAKCEKVCEHIHLPAQSGNNTILKKMNRNYTIEHYKNLISVIRGKFANIREPISITTDIIVGFPGETRQQFQDTVKLFKKIKYDMAYISQYSPRPVRECQSIAYLKSIGFSNGARQETAAYKLKDNVPKQEKKRREKVLTQILEKTALENNKKLIGKIVEVLVEKVKPSVENSHNNSHKFASKFACFGRTRTFKNVCFNGSNNLIGRFVKIKIAQADAWGLKGELIN